MGFIEENILRDIKSIFGQIKTFIPLVNGTIPKKETRGGPKTKFMGIVRMNIGPTLATKNF